MFSCNSCIRSFKSQPALNAHKRSHTDYHQIPLLCCSVYSKQEVTVSNLSRHNTAFLANPEIPCKNPKCQQLFKPTWKGQIFHSQSCAASFNNIAFDRKRGPDPKPKVPLLYNPKNRVVKPNVVKVKPFTLPKPLKIKGLRGRPTTTVKIPTTIEEGSYTRIILNTCAISGKKFYAPTYQKYHPDALEGFNGYRAKCKFDFSISQFPLWFDGNIIKQYGWYSTPGSRKGIKNLNGVSRDHMLSVSDGYKLDIDPKLIAHPANLELMPHKSNQKKNMKSSITLDELKNRIKEFELLYPNSLIR
jgi:hypothetical protein